MKLERINHMEKYILDKGVVSINELSTHFDTSYNTVRRDIKVLIDRGKVKKVHGGVAAYEVTAPIVPLQVRASQNIDRKVVIGQLASKLVKDRMSIFIDSGTTTIQIIPYISQMNDVIIVTHSHPTFLEIIKYPSLRVILLGGSYIPATGSFYSTQLLDLLSSFRFDIAFMAAVGVSSTHGLSNTTQFEVDVKRAVVQNNNRIVLMADHSKFHRSALLSFCPISKLSAIITDEPLPNEFDSIVAENAIDVIYPAI